MTKLRRRASHNDGRDEAPNLADVLAEEEAVVAIVRASVGDVVTVEDLTPKPIRGPFYTREQKDIIAALARAEEERMSSIEGGMYVVCPVCETRFFTGISGSAIGEMSLHLTCPSGHSNLYTLADAEVYHAEEEADG